MFHTHPILTELRPACPRGFAQTRPTALAAHLPALVEVVTTALEPSRPILRRTCLQVATALVKELVRRYPVVAFHPASMQLCVGYGHGGELPSVSASSAVVSAAVAEVYNLQSATRTRTLEDVEGAPPLPRGDSVACVAFSADGASAAAFSTPSEATPGVTAAAGSGDMVPCTLHVWALAASWHKTLFMARGPLPVHACLRRSVPVDASLLAHRTGAP